jgi:hypothetical protein
MAQVKIDPPGGDIAGRVFEESALDGGVGGSADSGMVATGRLVAAGAEQVRRGG